MFPPLSDAYGQQSRVASGDMKASQTPDQPVSSQRAPASAPNTEQATTQPELHPALEPLQDLFGTWKGAGHGKYSTIKDFDYAETVSLTPLPGKPFVRMENRSASPEGKPMHMELGFIRCVGGEKAAGEGESKIELIMAQATGQAEVLYGNVTRTEKELRIDAVSRSVTNTDTAKTVDTTERSLVLNLETGILTHSCDMAAVGEELQNHLISHLKKAD